MMAKAATDKATPEEAVAWAQKEIELIYKKWVGAMPEADASTAELAADYGRTRLRHVSACVILGSTVDTDRAEARPGLPAAGRSSS